MNPRSRLLLLARSYARAWPSQGRHLHPGVPGRRKVGAHFKGGCNRETIRFRSTIENKLDEQDLKLVGLEGELKLFEGRIAAEEELFKHKEQKDAEALECAMNEVKFSVVKGAGAFIGLTAALGSIVANMSRITEWFSGKGSA